MEAELKISVLDIVQQTMADGPGLRTSIYCAGCEHHCPGCHNPQSWNINNGKWMSVGELFDIIVSDTISNVTFTGGDPFYQAEAFTALARKIKTETNKNIWCWTGFTIEQIRQDPEKNQLLEYIDTLVDGPFILEQRDVTLLFRGSPNQRIIYLTPQDEDICPGAVELIKLR